MDVNPLVLIVQQIGEGIGATVAGHNIFWFNDVKELELNWAEMGL